MAYSQIEYMPPSFEHNRRLRKGERIKTTRKFRSGWWLVPAILLAIPVWVMLIRLFLSMF